MQGQGSIQTADGTQLEGARRRKPESKKHRTDSGSLRVPVVHFTTAPVPVPAVPVPGARCQGYAGTFRRGVT
jgi:hypothetical protein